MNSLRVFLFDVYNGDKQKGKTDAPNWLANAVEKFYEEAGATKQKKVVVKIKFDELYVKYSQGRARVAFDVTKVDKNMLDSIYDYIENEFEYVEEYPMILQDHPEAREIKPRGENYMSGIFKELRAFFNWAYKTKVIDSFPFEGFEMPAERYGSPVYLTLDDVQKIYSTDMSARPAIAVQRDVFVFQCNVGCRVGDLLRLKKRDVINGAVEYIPTKTIKESARTVVVPLNKVAQEIVDRYADSPGDKLLPFESSERYNDNIKIILELAGITYLVTVLDTVTRTEKKVPINEIASSHMARRTFIGNIYKLVKDPNLVSALTGHVEGSRAFNRYRTIDIDMKKDLVKILEGNN